MTSASPLAGITVVELGHNVAAPFCGKILAGLGATVVKVENPDGGDPTRDWGPPFIDDVAVTFHALNNGKRGLALDLRDEDARRALRAFIENDADVVIQNLKPGSTEAFGLDGQTMTAAKPGLIYCNLSAFGAKGPLRHKPGYDPLMQAFSGLMGVTGEEGRPPVRVGVSLIDIGAGLWSAVGILAALNERAATGIGGIVDTSLFETALSWMSLPAAAYLAAGTIPKRHGSGAAQIVPYQVFSTATDDIMIAAGNDRLFAKLCAVLQCPDLTDRFPTNRMRVEQRETLVAALSAVLGGRSADHWNIALDAAGVPNAPLRDIGRAVTDPQTIALGIIQEADGGNTGLIGLPLSFDSIRPLPRTAAPAMGEFNAALGLIP